MTRVDLIRDYFGATDFDMVICSRCIDALHSRGERIMTTDYTVASIEDIEEFIEDDGFENATDGTEPCGCEWCEEVDDLYGVIWK